MENIIEEVVKLNFNDYQAKKVFSKRKYEFIMK